MKIKKIPFYIAPWFLMSGACLTIGLLSFGGMLALWPSVPIAIGAFVLSVAYEGEIYLQNTKGALKKLFKSTYLERQLAKKCLQKDFPTNETSLQTCPEFFKDYEKQLHLLHRFEGKRLDKASRARQKQVEKTLADMEKWFAVQLFSDKPPQTKYQKDLHAWFELKGDKYRKKRDSRVPLLQWVKAFCLLAGSFTGIGTSYLLVEVFAVVPGLSVLPFATLPLFIVPMAAISGVAYGLLIYNAATDMIADEMVLNWYNKITDYSKQGMTSQNVLRIMGLAVILALNVILAVCTFGTWWTVAKTTRPLFEWMSKLPAFIMLVLNPLISAVSIFIFNVENVSESLEMLEKAIKTKETEEKTEAEDNLKKTETIVTENWLQRLNPFRFFIDMTFDRFLYLLFAGHIVSISATADRVPGVAPLFSALPCGANEVLEDLHYFNLGGEAQVHKHDIGTLLKERLSRGGGHNHDKDLPTKLLTLVYIPLYMLAAAWDSICSRGNTGDLKVIDFWSALDKEMGIPKEETVTFTGVDVCPEPVSRARTTGSLQPSTSALSFVGLKKKRSEPLFKSLLQPAWPFEHAAYRIERHKEKCLQGAWVGQDIAEEQMIELSDLQLQLYEASQETKNPKSVNGLIQTHINGPVIIKAQVKSVYDQHRFFFSKPTGKTETRLFLESLPARVARTGANHTGSCGA